MSLQVLIEACVETAAEARAAVQAGARRIELCTRLDVGGLTPRPEIVAEVVAAVDVPVFVLIRSRAGDFCYSTNEIDRMASDGQRAIEAGAAGLVIGALTKLGDIEPAQTRVLVDAACSLPTTFHKAFDATRDLSVSLEQLIGLGINRVLTSGGRESAQAGSDVLASLVQQAQGRIEILAGGRVRADHAAALVGQTGVREVHARQSAIVDLAHALNADSGRCAPSRNK